MPRYKRGGGKGTSEPNSECRKEIELRSEVDGRVGGGVILGLLCGSWLPSLPLHCLPFCQPRPSPLRPRGRRRCPRRAASGSSCSSGKCRSGESGNRLQKHIQKPFRITQYSQNKYWPSNLPSETAMTPSCLWRNPLILSSSPLRPARRAKSVGNLSLTTMLRAALGTIHK